MASYVYSNTNQIQKIFCELYHCKELANYFYFGPNEKLHTMCEKHHWQGKDDNEFEISKDEYLASKVIVG
jgi:hypothetical protein